MTCARLRCGFSFWGYLAHEAEQTAVETPDGLRGERAFFVTEMLRRGHVVTQLQHRHERSAFAAENSAVEYDPEGFPELDVLFVEWRWPRLGKMTDDWDRQTALLDHYSRIGTPIIVQDTDLKITVENELRWPRMIIGDPCLLPTTQTRRRIQMPFCNIFPEKISVQAEAEPVKYTYVGNNYERQQQFECYYAEPAGQLRAFGIQTTVHGNWLTKSPERMHPRAIVQQYPNVAFAPRISYRDVNPTLRSSLAVCHISKPEYSGRGNVTVRYFEAIAAGVPALIPAESHPMRSVGEAAGLLVGSSHDVVQKVRELAYAAPEHRANLVKLQQQALRELANFSPEHKVDCIEAAAERILKP